MAIGNKQRFDLYTILIYAALVFIGWISIYSAAPVVEYGSIFDMDELFGKQMIWIALAVVIIIFLLAMDVKFFERFGSVIYIISLLSLLGLFVFGKEINGAKSWYSLGTMTLQPSEFAKAATALAVAKYLSGIHISLKNTRDLLITGFIIALPALIIIPQPDPGSALVYGAFFFALHREGLSLWYLSLVLVAIGLFLGTLLIGSWWITLIIMVGMALIYMLSRKQRHKNRLPKPRKVLYIILAGLCVLYSLSTNYIFNNLLEDRHRNRIDIVLGRVEDNQGVGYNINQSVIAVGSGGFTGKGLLQGTQTQGGFVPEQETDFIFSAIGEEWGFMGASLVIILFISLIYRLILMAERQRNQFARIYGYCVAGIFFIHFFINIGMVLGLLPTVGIPLPFMSYGGSGLWGFTILLFIFVKLDGHRMSYEH
ncbi:rod shape-determining protein RodA [Nonlabens sp.]|uniref:rod shape-determining protein RodA n=1 Tax=Nonlabens sp. TaxID=1888209 RepID=UPI003F69BD03